MSRMGNMPITLSAKVKLEINGQSLKISGPKGEHAFTMPEGITAEVDGAVLHIRRANDERETKMAHGMVRSIVNAMVIGVETGFKKELELFGVGYRAQIAGQTLTLVIGYSNPVVYEVPKGVKVTMPDQTHITLESADKQLVGEVAAVIRRFRFPDAYHGKGVRFVGEQLSLKEGKKV